MFVFGWGRKVKGMGAGPVGECVHCGNVARPVLVERVGYFSVFFIPLISRSRFIEMCPVCHDGYELESRAAAHGRLAEARIQGALPAGSMRKTEQKQSLQCLQCGLVNEPETEVCSKCAASLPRALPALTA